MNCRIAYVATGLTGERICEELFVTTPLPITELRGAAFERGRDTRSRNDGMFVDVVN